MGDEGVYARDWDDWGCGVDGVKWMRSDRIQQHQQPVVDRNASQRFSRRMGVSAANYSPGLDGKRQHATGRGLPQRQIHRCADRVADARFHSRPALYCDFDRSLRLVESFITSRAGRVPRATMIFSPPPAAEIPTISESHLSHNFVDDRVDAPRGTRPLTCNTILSCDGFL